MLKAVFFLFFERYYYLFKDSCNHAKNAIMDLKSKRSKDDIFENCFKAFRVCVNRKGERCLLPEIEKN